MNLPKIFKNKYFWIIAITYMTIALVWPLEYAWVLEMANLLLSIKLVIWYLMNKKYMHWDDDGSGGRRARPTVIQ